MDTKAAGVWLFQCLRHCDGCRCRHPAVKPDQDFDTFYPVLQSWPHKPESKSNKDTQTKIITWQKVWVALRAHRCEAPLSARREFYQPPRKYKMSSASTAVGNSLRRSDETHTDIKTDTQEGTAGNRWKSRGGGSVFSVLVCVWALKAQISSGNPSFPDWGRGGRASGAAEVVYDQRDVKTVHLQQVDEEGAISLGIQPHGPHVLSGEGGINAPCYLGQDLEDAVIQLHEESRIGIKTAPSCYGPPRFLTIRNTNSTTCDYDSSSSYMYACQGLTEWKDPLRSMCSLHPPPDCTATFAWRRKKNTINRSWLLKTRISRRLIFSE